jgi:hypothetical protein
MLKIRASCDMAGRAGSEMAGDVGAGDEGELMVFLFY